MMGAEQLKAAYDKGWREAEWQIDGVRHLVALAEVARQQAERDAQIAERQDYGSKLLYGEAPYADARARAIAAAIRAQFANPSTTPKETR